VANTWTELTALDVYAMATNGKELQNPWFSLVGNFEKATTYVFAGRLIRNAEVKVRFPLQQLAHIPIPK